jgi:hypothetical protein
MKLEVTLELDIKITDGPMNINGIIKAVHQYQNELGRAIVTEILGAIDRVASHQVEERFQHRYRNKGYSDRVFRTPMGAGYMHDLPSLLISGPERWFRREETVLMYQPINNGCHGA